MVGVDLERREDARHSKGRKVLLLAVGKEDTCEHRRQVGKGHHLPDMSGSDDDEEVAAERPYHGTQRRQVPTEVEGTQQDIEAEEVGEDVPYVLRQPQVVGVDNLVEAVGAILGRRGLVRRHAAEGTAGPAAALAGLLVVLCRVLTQTATGGGVMAVKDTTLYVSRVEISKRDDCKKQHDDNIGNKAF